MNAVSPLNYFLINLPFLGGMTGKFSIEVQKFEGFQAL